MKLRLMSMLMVSAAAGSCQTYDFEPVQPLAVAQTTQTTTVAAKRLKPDLMFLIDKSGSMNFPSDSTNPSCPAGCGNGTACPASCPTRISELKLAMDTFLTQNGTIAWMGMAIFPTAQGGMGNTKVAGCGPTEQGDVKVELMPAVPDTDAAMTTAAGTVLTQIKAVSPGGGTPTADSLRFMASYRELQNPDREDFVLLLTDGLPNCNGQNVNTCATPSACKCTTASCAIANQQCQAGCLDKDNSTTAVTELRAKEIRTIVIGFGADTAAGDGPDTLNAMAIAGGFPRTCVNGTDAECGANNSCDTSTMPFYCKKKFYQATSATELAAALKEISKSLIQDPCTYTLNDTPSNPQFLAVIIDGKTVPGGQADTWEYSEKLCDAMGQCVSSVKFQGALCDKLSNATPNAPVQVEFRIVQSI